MYYQHKCPCPSISARQLEKKPYLELPINDAVKSIAYIGRNKYLAVATSSGIQIWDLINKGKLVQTIPMNSIESIASNDLGSTLAVSTNNSVKLFSFV